MKITNKLVVLESKTKAPLFIHFSKNITGVTSVSKTSEPEGLYGECYGEEWDENNMNGLSISLYYSKEKYLFEIKPTTKSEIEKIISEIDNLFPSIPTQFDFKQMKKDLGLTNSKIAEIIGLTEDSVKTMTQPNRELPTWAKSMIFVWKNK